MIDAVVVDAALVAAHLSRSFFFKSSPDRGRASGKKQI